MEIGETLYVTERADWRAWLEANFETQDEIWLVMPRQAGAVFWGVLRDANKGWQWR